MADPLFYPGARLPEVRPLTDADIAAMGGQPVLPPQVPRSAVPPFEVVEFIPDAPTPEPAPAKKGDLLGEAKKGAIVGARGAQQMGVALGALANSNVVKASRDSLAAFDRIDRGETLPKPVQGRETLVDLNVENYQQATPAQRAELRAQVLGALTQSKENVEAATAAWREYQAKIQAEQGRVPNLTDVRDTRDFGDWLAFSVGQGSVWMVPMILTALVGGTPALAAAGLTMGAGDLASNTMERAIGPGTNLGGAQAEKYVTPQAAQRVGEALSSEANTIGALSLPYAAAEAVFGPAARVASGAMRETARQAAGQGIKGIAKTAGKEAALGGAEEFGAETTQEFLLSVADRLSPEQTPLLTRENALRWLNAGAAGGASGFAFGGVGGAAGAAVARPKGITERAADAATASGQPMAVLRLPFEQEAQPIPGTGGWLPAAPQPLAGPDNVPRLPAPAPRLEYLTPTQVPPPTPPVPPAVDVVAGSFIADAQGGVSRETRGEQQAAAAARQRAADLGETPLRVPADRPPTRAEQAARPAPEGVSGLNERARAALIEAGRLRVEADRLRAIGTPQALATAEKTEARAQQFEQRATEQTRAAASEAGRVHSPDKAGSTPAPATPTQEADTLARAREPEVRGALERLAEQVGWAQRGGRLIREDGEDQTSPVTGRTTWVPHADWYPTLPAEARISDPAVARRAVQKAVAGEKMTAKERRFVEALLAVHDEQQAAPEPSAPVLNEEDRQAFERARAELATDEEAQAERAAIMAEAEGALVDAAASEGDIETLVTHTGEDALRALGFTEDEIADAQAQDTRAEGRAAEGGTADEQADAAGAPTGGRAREGAAAAEGQDFGLTAETPGEIRAREAARDRAAEEARRREAAPTPEDFTLTGSDRAADEAEARGQRSLLDQPAEDAKPLYAHRPVANPQAIIDWARSQGFKTTLPADDLHVTVAYSREPMDGKKVAATADAIVAKGGKRTVEPLGSEGAIVLKFDSPDLQARWQQYRDAGASWDYEDYTPHITITYDGQGIDPKEVEPYTGPIELGPEQQEPLNVDKADDYKEAGEVPTGAAQPAATPEAQQPAPVEQSGAQGVAAAEADREAKPAARETIADVGEKIGGARKDTATSTGPRGARPRDETPGWRKRYVVSQIVASARAGETGRWVILDSRSKDWRGQPKQVGNSFDSQAQAEAAIPLVEVARNHRVLFQRDADGAEKYAIFRTVSERKRVQVVQQLFDTDDAAKRYMAEHAAEIVETKTSFGEEILPRPDRVVREGAQRREGDVKGEDFLRAFGFRAVEFGLWEAQDERQTVMNHAYDALMDLADVLGVPPRALGLNGELALAFGARGQGLSGARAHYEPDYGVINLTKMSGAGSLAHEWMHAADHYFARQDTKATSEKAKNARGDTVLKNELETESKTFASYGFSGDRSKARAELRAAYDAVMDTLRYKAEQYVEDTQKADRFVAEARTDVANRLQRIREHLANRQQYGSKKEPATAEQLARFDAIAEKIIAGEYLDLDWKRTPGSKGIGTYRWSNDAIEALSAVYKEVRGRSGMTAQGGPLVDLAGDMKRYGARLKMLADAQQQTAKTRKLPTGFATEAKRIDQGRASDYWATPHEMLARAFQAYVEDRIADRGGRSDFLTYGTHFVVPTPWGWARPFPEGAEREAINAVFDRFVATLRARETDSGVALEDRTDSDVDRTPSGEGTVDAIDAVLPPAVQPAYVATPKQLATAFRKWEAGQISDEQFRLAVRAEIERRQDRRLLRGARVRGAEWLRERLIRARRTGELSAEQVNLALWLLDQAPQVATDLGISIKDGDNEIANGTYNVLARIVTIFASNSNANTATHEILHHTERMMPAAVQAGIRAEWLRQLRQQVAAAREKADAGQRAMLDWMLEAAEAGQDQLALSIWKGLGGNGLSGLVDYQYAAASEFWAVNAARLLRERHEATTWIGRARQWLRELIAKVRALFDLPSDAAVIRGLEAVMEGDGSFVSPSMISRLNGTVNEEGGEFADLTGRDRRPDWIRQQPAETQEALRRAGIWTHAAPWAERFAEWKKRWRLRMTQGVADQFAPLKELGYHEYVLARMSRGADNALEALLMHGVPFMDAEGAINVRYEKGGFLGTLSGLQDEHDRFIAWVVGNRAQRLLAEGREHNFTADHIARLLRLNDGTMPDGKRRAVVYERAATELDRYNRAVMDIAQRAGLIDADSRKVWEKAFYVPFYRVMEGDQTMGPRNYSGLVDQYAFKTLKGGEKELGDPLENMLRNWSHILDASLKNNAAREALQAAERAGVAIEADEWTARAMAKATDNRRGVVSFVDQGVRRWYLVDDLLVLDALRAIGFTGFDSTAMRVMGKFKRWLTLGVTVSPTFRIRNVIRDSLSMIGTNPASYNVLGNVLAGWRGTKEGSPEYAQIIAGGGVMRFGTLLEGDRAAHVKRLIEAGVKDKTILDTPGKVKAAMQAAWDWWQHTGDRAENINRVALYQQLRAQGASHLEASFRARDVIDFSLQGSWGAIRFLTQTVPFFNARLQGLYKLGRGAAEDPKRFAAVTGATALASVLLLLYYRDDDDWKKREDWDRETFWWFKVGDTAYRIPKPFEIGALATVAERMVELLASDEFGGEDFAKSMLALVSQQLSMNPTPQVVMPAIELWANKDAFTGRPIETAGMEKLPKSERAGPNTSAVAQALGAPGVLSPAQIDHLIGGYFGWLGINVVALSDLAARPALGLPPKATARLDDIFVVGDFAKELPAYQSRYVTRLYEHGRQFQEVLAEYKLAAMLRDNEKVKELQAEHGQDIQLGALYERAQQALSKLNAEIRRTQLRDLPADEKRARLDDLYARRNAFARVIESKARAIRQAAPPRR